VAVAVAASALLVAPAASARRVRVHVNVKDPQGYRMSIEASRSARGPLATAHRKVAGNSEPAPLEALSRSHVARATRVAKMSRPGRPHSGLLSIQVENRHAISTYNVPGTVTHNRLYGELGKLGRISLRFHLHRSRTRGGRCNRTHERFGSFTGRVRFRGENEYVDVDAHRMRGTVKLPGRRSRRRGCSVIVTLPPVRSRHGSQPKRAERPRHDRYAILLAESERTYFAALKEAREWSAFGAATIEDRGPVLIVRERYAEGKAPDFRVNRRLTSARIDPRRNAFRGSARFRAPHRWRGPLETSFPGAPKVRLAGRGFRAFLEPLKLFFD
jgi:hypothetical protein